MASKPYMVDLPDPNKIVDGDLAWTNVGMFATKEEAIAWIRRYVSHCDDDGNINLVTHCPDNTDDDHLLDQLISDAAEAEERILIDELEQFALEQRDKHSPEGD